MRQPRRRSAIDLLRVRRARYAVLADPSGPVKKPKARRLIGVAKRLLRGGEMDESFEAVLLALQGAKAQGAPTTLEDRIEAIAARLARLDRYERRALSRRKTAIGNFDGLAPPKGGPRAIAWLGQGRGTRRSEAGRVCERKNSPRSRQ